MFINLIIDTKQKKRPVIRFNTKKFNPAHGWKKAIHVKKRSIWQRIKSWKRSLKDGCYRFGDQIAMF